MTADELAAVVLDQAEREGIQVADVIVALRVRLVTQLLPAGSAPCDFCGSLRLTRTMQDRWWCVPCDAPAHGPAGSSPYRG